MPHKALLWACFALMGMSVPVMASGNLHCLGGCASCIPGGGGGGSCNCLPEHTFSLSDAGSQRGHCFPGSGETNPQFFNSACATAANGQSVTINSWYSTDGVDCSFLDGSTWTLSNGAHIDYLNKNGVKQGCSVSKFSNPTNTHPDTDDSYEGLLE